MQISTKARYALRIMIDLAAHSAGGKVKIREISERQNISVKYLEQVINALSKAGLVTGERGPQGGYVITVDPSSITAGDIIRLVDGPTSPAPCHTPDGGTCPMSGRCASEEMWSRIEEATDSILDSYRISDLAERSLVLLPSSEKPEYCI